MIYTKLTELLFSLIILSFSYKFILNVISHLRGQIWFYPVENSMTLIIYTYMLIYETSLLLSLFSRVFYTDFFTFLELYM